MGIKTEIPSLFGWWLQYFWNIFLVLVAMGVWDLWPEDLSRTSFAYVAAPSTV
jgi:hypothetical protein